MEKIEKAAGKAGLRINPRKTKIVPIRRSKTGGTAEEGIRRLGFKVKCEACGRMVPKEISLKKHRERSCKPGQQLTRYRTLADKMVRDQKIKDEMEGDSRFTVNFGGELLKPVVSEKYLGAQVNPTEGVKAEVKH